MSIENGPMTKGPWRWVDESLIAGDNKPVLLGIGYNDSTDGVCVNTGDADLIAAAPELYEALQGMMEMYDAPENLDAPQRVAIWSRAQAAIKKARGEA